MNEREAWKAELAEIKARVSAGGSELDQRRALAELLALYKRMEESVQATGVLQAEVRELGSAIRKAGRGPGEGTAGRRVDRLGASTFVERGWHLISLGDYPAAIAALERALERAPGLAEAGTLLGWAQMLGGQLDEAMVTLQGVLAREPSHALARVNLGFICLRKRIFGEAIEHLSRVIRETTDRRGVLYAHYYLGMVYLERGMYEDAIAFLERALELGPNLVEARYEFGRALWLADRRDEAREVWRIGSETGTYSPWGERCRELLTLAETGGEIPRPSS